MPRIRQKADDYAIKDYMGEIKAQSARLGYDAQESLGNAVWLSRPTISKYLKDPMLYLGTLRNMVQKLKLDPVIVLRAIGYSTNDIKKLRKDVG